MSPVFAAQPAPGKLTRVASRARQFAAFQVAQILAKAVALFRPIQSLSDIETRTAPDGTEMELEVKTPAVFVDQMRSSSWSYFDAWVQRDDSAVACLNVRLLGYWIEVHYESKQAKS